MNKGVTLIELIMVVVVVGALSLGSAPFINAVVERWQFLQFRNEIGMQARIALDRMARDVRMVRDSSSFDIADSAQLKFTDSYDTSIDYTLSGNTLMRNSDALADYTSSLQYGYRDGSNSTLTPLPLNATQRTQIRRVKVSLTVASGEQSLTLSSDLFPRNLGE